MSIFDHYGKDFFENQLPEIIEELHRIGDAVSPKENTVAEIKPEFVEDTHRTFGVVYVCYEENSVELYNDAGNISNMYVTADVDKAKEWANFALNNAKKNEYFPISEEEKTELHDSIGRDDYASVWVYKDKNENARENYGICVDKRSSLSEPESAFKKTKHRDEPVLIHIIFVELLLLRKILINLCLLL